jgi:hypothetical protein
VILNRERVLNRLSQLSHEAQQKGQYSASARCEELIGRALGLFIDRTDHSFQWDGDLTKLTDEQLERLIPQLEACAAEYLAHAKKPARLDAGAAVIDVEPVPG